MPRAAANALQEAEPLPVGAGDDAADQHGGDERVPAGLAVHHPDVVGIAHVPVPVLDPAQLESLTLGGGARHARNHLQDAQRLAESDQLGIVEKRLERQREHRVADVDGDGDAMGPVQGGATAT